MDPLIKAELEKPELSDFHKTLLKHVKDLVMLSRRKMGEYYEMWDHHDDVYKGIKRADVSDKKASERGEPTKMVIPLSYAQVQTFVAFGFTMFFQRPNFFELEGKSIEDVPSAKVGESLLARDLEKNVIEAKLYQALLDTARFGLSVFKIGWVRETQVVTEMVPAAPVFGLGVELLSNAGRMEEAKIAKTSFLGNKIVNVSPYRFFPDVRLPICRFQEGEFVASEDEYTIVDLKQMESNGDIVGVDLIKPLGEEGIKTRSRFASLRSADETSVLTGSSKPTNSAGTVVVTEAQVKLIPARFMVGDKPMGPEEYPVKYNVWYANDGRILKCEPLGYDHGEFTYTVGQYNPDMHNLVGLGLCESIDKLQEVISWFINSHITSVRKTIDNKFIVDPSGVEMSDLAERRPVIRLKDAAQRQGGVERWIQQLQVQDVTSRHMQDAEILEQIVQVVTGINDNALGQFNMGRRSATEARNVNSATSARLKVIVSLIWKTLLQPMGQQMLSNLRNGLDEETYIKVIGEFANPQVMTQFKKVSKKDLVGAYDFSIFDGTMPSERIQQAALLQEFVTELISVPQLLPALGYDITALVKEVLELRGIRNPDKFRVPVMPLQVNPQQMGLPNGQQLGIPPTNAALPSAGPGMAPPTAGITGQPVF